MNNNSCAEIKTPDKFDCSESSGFEFINCYSNSKHKSFMNNHKEILKKSLLLQKDLLNDSSKEKLKNMSESFSDISIMPCNGYSSFDNSAFQFNFAFPSLVSKFMDLNNMKTKNGI